MVMSTDRHIIILNLKSWVNLNRQNWYTNLQKQGTAKKCAIRCPHQKRWNFTWCPCGITSGLLWN